MVKRVSQAIKICFTSASISVADVAQTRLMSCVGPINRNIKPISSHVCRKFQHAGFYRNIAKETLNKARFSNFSYY